MATREEWRRGAFVVGTLGALTVLFTYPLSVHPRSMALSLSADTRLFLWTISWDVHALVHQPFRLFDANIFFPEHRTLAYSEHLFGSALLVSPLLLMGERLLALNALVLLSCLLSGIGCYVLARQVGASPAGSLIAGVIFAFAPTRFFRLGQIHLACIEWIPFCLAALHFYARTGARRGLILAALAFTAQALTSGHGGLFLVLGASLLLVFLWGTDRLPAARQLARDLGALGILILVLNLPFLVPYFEVRSEVGLHRTLGAVEDWTPNPISYIAAPTYLGRALLGARIDGAKAFLFPGITTLLLALASLLPLRKADAPVKPEIAWRLLLPELLGLFAGVAALWIRSAGDVDTSVFGVAIRARSPVRAALVAVSFLAIRILLAPRRPPELGRALRNGAITLRTFGERRMGPATGFYVLLALLSVWASLGPPFWLYTLLYRTIPGFDLVRVPSRLTLLTVLALAVLASLGFDRIFSGGKRIPAAAAILLFCVAEFLAPLGARAYSIPDPPIDHAILQLPADAALVELPVVDPGDAVGSARLHSVYLLHSLAHFHPMVNGYSGFIPPRHEELFRLLADFPDEASLHALEGLSVHYAVVHPELYPRGEWPRAEARLASFPGRLRLVTSDDADRLYELLGASH